MFSIYMLKWWNVMVILLYILKYLETTIRKPNKSKWTPTAMSIYLLSLHPFCTVSLLRWVMGSFSLRQGYQYYLCIKNKVVLCTNQDRLGNKQPQNFSGLTSIIYF